MNCPFEIDDPICIISEQKGREKHFYQRPGCASFSNAKRLAENNGVILGENKNECMTGINKKSGEKTTTCICTFDHCNIGNSHNLEKPRKSVPNLSVSKGKILGFQL